MYWIIKKAKTGRAYKENLVSKEWLQESRRKTKWTTSWQMRKALWLINLRMLYILLPNNARSHVCHMENQSKSVQSKQSQHAKATYGNNVGCNMLWSFGHRVVTCWVLLAQVWKWSTHRNRVAKHMQHFAPKNVAIFCIGMLWTFGRGFSVDQSSLKQLSLTCWHLNLLVSVSCSQNIYKFIL